MMNRVQGIGSVQMLAQLKQGSPELAVPDEFLNLLVTSSSPEDLEKVCNNILNQRKKRTKVTFI